MSASQVLRAFLEGGRSGTPKLHLQVKPAAAPLRTRSFVALTPIRRSSFALQDTAFNKNILLRCKTAFQTYKVSENALYQLNCPYAAQAAYAFAVQARHWLFNGHIETIFAAKFRRSPGLRYSRECLIMPDGGTVAIDFEPLDLDQVH